MSNLKNIIVKRPDGKTYKINDVEEIEYDANKDKYRITCYERNDKCICKLQKGSRIIEEEL